MRPKVLDTKTLLSTPVTIEAEIRREGRDQAHRNSVYPSQTEITDEDLALSQVRRSALNLPAGLQHYLEVASVHLVTQNRVDEII